MTVEEAITWLEIDVGGTRPDAPANIGEAFLRAVPLDEGQSGAETLLTLVGLAILTTEPDRMHMVTRALATGARLARHAADLETLGARA